RFLFFTPPPVISQVVLPTSHQLMEQFRQPAPVQPCPQCSIGQFARASTFPLTRFSALIGPRSREAANGSSPTQSYRRSGGPAAMTITAALCVCCCSQRNAV